MTDYQAGTGSFLDEETGTPAGGRRAEKSRRRGPGCLIGLVVLALLFGGLYYGVTKGIDVVKDQFEGTPDYPGPGTGEVVFEVRGGDTRDRHRPQPQGDGHRQVRRRLHRRGQRQPRVERHPGRLLRDAPADEGRGRPRAAHRPGQRGRRQHHHPRGSAGRGHREDPREEHGVLQAGVRGRAGRPRRARPAGLRRGQPGGLPVPRDLRVRPQPAARRHAARPWSRAGSRPSPTSTSWPRRRPWATRRTR